MASQAKSNLLEQHQLNRPLNLPLLAQVRRSPKDFSADDVFSPLDERIIAGAADALDAGATHYVDVPGIMPLREAMAAFLNGSSGAEYQAGNIIITAGVQESRFLTIQKIGEQYDSIAVPNIVHPGVHKALGVRHLTAISLPIDAKRGHLPTMEGIAAAVAGGCRLLYLESPSRLSGAVYSPDEVAAIGKILRENDAAAIWDQGLSVWVEGNYASLATMEDRPTRIATIGDAFPGTGLGSWFIGYIGAPEDWIPNMQSQKQIMAICTSTATQYAALAASSIYDEAHGGRLEQLKGYRRELVELANAAGIEVVAGDTASVLAIRPNSGGEAACARLRDAGIESADGSLFGAPDVLRLTVNNMTGDALAVLS